MAKNLFYLTNAKALGAIRSTKKIIATSNGPFGKEPAVILTQLEDSEIPKTKKEVDKSVDTTDIPTGLELGGYVKFSLDEDIKKTLVQADNGIAFGRPVFKHKGDLDFSKFKAQPKIVDLQ